MNYPLQRAGLLQTLQLLSDSDLSQGTSGNISTRVDEGFLVTPSAMATRDCEAGDMVLVNQEGRSMDRRKPSSEWRLHHDIYQHHADAMAIIHCHAPWCTTLACLQREIPAFHYMVALGGGENIRCAPYATYGTQALSTFVLEALNQRRACLMANHGMVCFAESLQAAFDLAEGIEWLARVYCQALQAGQPVMLSATQIEEALEKFLAYRCANAP